MAGAFSQYHQGCGKTRRLRVLLVGQHTLAREGLRRLLEGEQEVEVIAEAGSTEEALRATQCFHPDLALIDMSLPTRLGIVATQAITAHCHATRVVALLMEGDEPYRDPLQIAGASVVLHRGYGHELLTALHAVWSDETIEELRKKRGV